MVENKRILKLLGSKVLVSIITFLGIIAVLFYLVYLLFQSVKTGTPFPNSFASPILAILGVVISIIALTFVSIVFSFINQSDKRYALGLPQGSVRALIALCLVSSFIIISVVLFNSLNDRGSKKISGLTREQFEKIPGEEILSVESVPMKRGIPGEEGAQDSIMTYNIERAPGISSEVNDFAKQLLTILSTLAIAVCAFYFGSKATEMGGQQAMQVLEATHPKEEEPKPVPPEIIDEAIFQNKDHWIAEYKCKDIVRGKKQLNGVTFNQYSIVFIVESKESPPPDAQRVPSQIRYFSSGKEYLIPTDVQEAPKEPPSN